MQVRSYIAVVDGQLIQRTQSLEESPCFVRDMWEGGIDNEMETVADIEAFEAGQLWVIPDHPNSLGEDIFKHHCSVDIIIDLIFII